MGLEQTIHEIGQIDNETSFLGIVIRQYAIVDELPSKGIGYHDDYAFGSCAVSWIRDIGLQPIDRGGFAARHSIVNMAFETVWARHLESFRSQSLRCSCGAMW